MLLVASATAGWPTAWAALRAPSAAGYVRPARRALAYGFHSAGAALALIMLTLGPIEHVLQHERGPDPQIDPHSCLEAPFFVSHVSITATQDRQRGLSARH